MRYVKIAPNVANVTCGRKTLEDKQGVWPESMWPEGHVDELLKRKFLILVEEPEREIDIPVEEDDKKTIKKKLTKDDFKNNPELKIQGFKPGDEIDIPVEEENQETDENK